MPLIFFIKISSTVVFFALHENSEKSRRKNSLSSSFSQRKKGEKRKHLNVYVTIVINLLAQSKNVNISDEKYKQDTTTSEQKTC